MALDRQVRLWKAADRKNIKTVVELCERVRMSRNTYYDYTNYAANLSYKAMARVKRALGLSPAECGELFFS